MNTNSHRKANWSRLGAWLLVSVVWAVGIMHARQDNESNAKLLYQQALHEKDARGNLKAAIALYERVLAAKPDRALAATALLQMADCYERLGMAETRKTYERVVREFSDQSEEAAVAKARMAALPAVATKADSGVINKKLFDSPNLAFPEEAVSPDGRYIAYPSIQPGPRGLIVRDLMSGKDRQLTDYGMDRLATTSIFSPDSRMIAFRVVTKQPNGQDLRIIRADGSGERVIFENENVTASHPQDWSRDGKNILTAFNTKDRTWQIAIISVADGSVRRIKTSNWQLGPPSALFSPDGSQIVYDQLQQVGTTSSDIFLLAADGSREQRLVQHPADDKIVGWAPDGRLLFTSDRSGTLDLYALRVSAGIAASNPEIVQRQIPGSGHGLTRDGTLHYINFHKVNGAYIAGLDIKSGKLTTPPVPVTETTRDYNWTPAFSPDGGQVAVISFRGVGRIYAIIKSLTTATQEREIHVEGLRVAYDLLWHPDGKSLLIRGNDKEFQWGSISWISRQVVWANPFSGFQRRTIWDNLNSRGTARFFSTTFATHRAGGALLGAGTLGLAQNGISIKHHRAMILASPLHREANESP
jgi:Tol biopolymer transport system component